MKTCTKCKLEKDESEFYKRSKRRGGIASWCKICASIDATVRQKANPEKHRKSTIKWYKNNPEKVKKNRLNWVKNNPEKERQRHRTYKYNMLQEEYNNLLEEQKNVRAICGKPETRVRNEHITLLSVDHNHKTGKNRGLLCTKCNTALQYFDDIEFYNKVIEYLLKY